MKKNSPFIVGSAIAVIGIVIVMVVFSGTFVDESNISSESKIPTYIPSDITKINPKFVIESGESLWVTTDVKDVKDDVIFTLQGTVLSIDNPVDWNLGGPVSALTNQQQIMGFVPITISIEKIYKGNLSDDEFTFYLTSHKYNDKYNFPPDAAQFEIGEKILIHLAHSDLGPFPDGKYYPILAQFGKYKLQSSVSVVDGVIGTVTDDSLLAFNVHHPNGIPLDLAAGKSLP